MKISVIKPDQVIYIDGISAEGCNVDSINNFHAFHYDTETGGEIELSDTNEILNSDDDINTHTGISLTTFITRYNTRRTEIEAEITALG